MIRAAIVVCWVMAIGLALFLITLLLNLIALRIVRRYREQYE